MMSSNNSNLSEKASGLSFWFYTLRSGPNREKASGQGPERKLVANIRDYITSLLDSESDCQQNYASVDMATFRSALKAKGESWKKFAPGIGLEDLHDVESFIREENSKDEDDIYKLVLTSMAELSGDNLPRLMSSIRTISATARRVTKLSQTLSTDAERYGIARNEEIDNRLTIFLCERISRALSASINELPEMLEKRMKAYPDPPPLPTEVAEPIRDIRSALIEYQKNKLKSTIDDVYSKRWETGYYHLNSQFNASLFQVQVMKLHAVEESKFGDIDDRISELLEEKEAAFKVANESRTSLKKSQEERKIAHSRVVSKCEDFVNEVHTVLRMPLEQIIDPLGFVDAIEKIKAPEFVRQGKRGNGKNLRVTISNELKVDTLDKLESDSDSDMSSTSST